VLALDAMTNSAPAMFAVLTTRTATMDMARFQNALKATRRALARELPEARIAQLVEFQTGRGRNSGGERRPHWNWMIKGTADATPGDVSDLVVSPWCERVDAEPEAQRVQRVHEAGGLMRYLALHFQKQDQAPPEGWRGHRFRVQKGYLAQPMPEAREQARQSLRLKRELHRLAEQGLSGQELEDAAHQALYEANELAWELVRVQPIPTAFDADDQPTDWGEMIVPVRS
jgi:hypothetical protein